MLNYTTIKRFADVVGTAISAALVIINNFRQACGIQEKIYTLHKTHTKNKRKIRNYDENMGKL